MPLKDPQKRLKYDREYRKANIERVRKRESKFRQERKQWLVEYKSTLSCEICGEKRILCLDFHHRDKLQKDVNISTAIYRYSIKRLLEEIEKCDVLCANCHRVEHEGGT